MCVCIPYTVLLRLTLSNSLRRLGTTLAFDVYLTGRRLTYRWPGDGEWDGAKTIGVYFVFGLDTPKETCEGRGKEKTQENGVVNNNLRIIYALSGSGAAVLGCCGDGRGTRSCDYDNMKLCHNRDRWGQDESQVRKF